LSKLLVTLVAVVTLAATAALVRLQPHPARAAPAADVSAVPQPAAPVIAERWSAPANLSGCPTAPAAQVVFPSDKPTQATGSGAIVWAASPACPGGEGARVTAIGDDDLPGATIVPRTAKGQVIAPRGSLASSAAPHGQIVIAGAAAGSSHAAGGLLVQGPAPGPFSVLATPGGLTTPTALTTAYLGDMALASPPKGLHGSEGLEVHVERFFTSRFVRNVPVPSGEDEALQSLTLAMDFRSEALAVWAQRGGIYASLIPNRGDARAAQRLASVGAHVHIAALLSDDRHGIVAWAEQNAGQTSVYIDRSKVGVRFAKPELLERFSDPDGLDSPAGSPRLVRLSSESVMLAWAGSAAGHWVVRTAPVDLRGVLTVGTIAVPGSDALLADMTPGPDDDALLVWTEPMPTVSGAPDLQRQALFAARGTQGGSGRAVFDAPEPVAAPGPVSDPAVAIDPADDAAVAVWQGEAGAIEYSVRSPAGAP
jgi:hypothetical protein